MSEPFVVLATFEKSFEAELARAALKDRGIDSFLSDENTVSNFWSLGTGVSGIKLNVRDKDAEQALALYREIESDLKSNTTIEDEELIRQALEGQREEEDLKDTETISGQNPDQSESLVEQTPVADTDSIDRENASRKLFFVAWLGLLVPGLGFFAFYLFLCVAFGSGRLRSQGRINLIAGGLITILSLIWAKYLVNVILSLIFKW